MKFPLKPESVLAHLATLGITETNFRLLLFNRWEFQESAVIPTRLEKAVKVLQTLYGQRI